MKKIKIFIAIFLVAGLTVFLRPNNIYSARDTEQWREHKEGLTQEGLTDHHVNDTIFKFNDVLFEFELDAYGNPIGAKGALPFASEAISAIYKTPPASGVYYAYNMFQNLGAKTAYAQGVGFSGLQPILPIWRAFRNITYVIFTLVFIFVGLAIMLRIKISPQAVVTIENAIPKIIGALILVTFSYAIAGFMIDLMYVFIALGINILTAGGVQAFLINIGPLQGFEATPQVIIDQGFFALIPMFFSVSTIGAGAAAIGAAIGALIGTIVSPGVGTLGGLLAGPMLVLLIWSVVALVLMFKLLFGLIKAYINIILAIILAPFQIMLGAIPGMQIGGFGKWFKGLVVELAIFPAVVIVAIIGVFILQQVDLNQMWTAPLIGPPRAGSFSSILLSILTGNYGVLIGANDLPTLIVKAIIGMGFLLILAKIPDIIRQAMKTETGYGAAIGQAIQPITYGAAAIGSARAMTVEKKYKDQIQGSTLQGRTKAEKAFWGFMSNITGGKVRT